MVAANPVTARLPAWSADRLALQDHQVDEQTLAFLVSRVEGNLLAAHRGGRSLRCCSRQASSIR
jgi:DNA polymerase III delta subunit